MGRHGQNVAKQPYSISLTDDIRYISAQTVGGNSDPLARDRGVVRPLRPPPLSPAATGVRFAVIVEVTGGWLVLRAAPYFVDVGYIGFGECGA